MTILITLFAIVLIAEVIFTLHYVGWPKRGLQFSWKRAWFWAHAEFFAPGFAEKRYQEEGEKALREWGH